MNVKSACYTILSGLVATVSCTGLAQAAGYTITDLGTLGGSSSTGTDINDGTQVTGYSKIAGDAATRGFLYSGSAALEIPTLGGSDAWAYGINNHGHVTGGSRLSGDTVTHAFYYDGVAVHDLGTLGGTYSSGYAANDAGQVTGTSRISLTNTFQHAFLYDGNTMQDLGTLGGDRSNGYGINSSGQVTGNSLISGSYSLWHAFLYDPATDEMQDLGTLGGETSQAYAINDAGHVTGTSDTEDGSRHAFLYDGATMHDLGTLGGSTSSGNSINNDGHVVGSSTTASGLSVAFVYDGTSMLNLCELTDCGRQGWTRLETASGINDTGAITGTGEINGESHAFLIAWSDQPIPELCTDGIDNDDDGLSDCEDVDDCGQATVCYVPDGMAYDLIDLGTLGGDYAVGNGINNNRQVTGSSRIAGDDAIHAFLHDGTGLQDLGVLEQTDIDSHGNGINDSGQIAGTSADRGFWGATDAKAFLYDNNVMQDLHALLDAPCNLASRGNAINDSGQVTGFCAYYIDNIWGIVDGHAILYDGNTMLDLGTLGGSNSEGLGINNLGHVTGWSSSPSGTHAFLYDGTMHDLGTLGGSYSSGSDINDAGQVTGRSTTADGLSHAFLYDGSMIDLGAFAGGFSNGLAINEVGQITGNSRLASGENAAFLFDNDRMLDLCAVTDCKARGWTRLVSAADINDQGDITGYGVFGGETHAFLAIALSAQDTDGDGIVDTADNCTLAYNPVQLDVDADDYGNACDADLDNDGIVTTLDTILFIDQFATGDPESDFTEDGLVNTLDIIMFINMFNQEPGPSGLVS